MNIISFKKYNYIIINDKDDTLRDIGYSIINNCVIVGRNSYYPNVLIYKLNDNILISPYDEKIMSLNKDSFYDDNKYDINHSLDDKNKIIDEPIFFFIYNFDNYYHFLYDTLPYLYTYLELKKILPNLKLLVNYPNKNMEKFYKFNTEILDKIININDIVIHNNSNVYKNLYISSSLTHGGYSNNPPRKEINIIIDMLKNSINLQNINDKYKNIKYLYISRRTWINNDTSNIGTNYTTRRKMINEDALVDLLNKKIYVEIFAENLNIDEKIYLFKNAKNIIGSIGGGMANLIFSDKSVKSIILISPYFLDINYRFKYCLENSDFYYFNFIKIYKEDNDIPLYTRVKILENNKIGEIIKYDDKKYLINISDNDIAGFNNDNILNKKYYYKNEFILLDNGLNSPYVVDIEKFSKISNY
jgi:capsular polysaccharide biosynthesis protein